PWASVSEVTTTWSGFSTRPEAMALSKSCIAYPFCLPGVPCGERLVLDDAVLLEQGADGVGGLGAVLHPLLGLLGVNLHHAGLLHGVVVADLLDETAVTGEAGVRHHDAVKGVLLGAHS